MTTNRQNKAAVVKAARLAQKQWRCRTLPDRLGFLSSFRDHIIAKRDDIVSFLNTVTGKPRYEALATELFPILSLVDQLLRLSPKQSPLSTAQTLWSRTREPGYDRQAVGVVVIVASLHAPFLSLLKIALPALVAGNAVVMLGQEQLKKVSDKILSLFDEAGLPAQLLFSIEGSTETTKEFVELGVDHLSFCAQAKQARVLAAHCGSHLTSCQAAIDSRGVALVLEGSPLLRCVRSIVTSSFGNHGLAPGAIRHIYVEATMASQFESLLLAETMAIRQGRDTQFQVDIGPLPKLELLQEITRFVSSARGQGLELLAGGHGLGYAFEDGPWFFQPTILKGDSDKLYERSLSIPGPIIILDVIQNNDHGIEQVNKHKDATLASVWGKNLDAVRQTASQLIHRRVALNDSGSLVLSGQKNPGFDLHIDALRIPLSLARSRPVHIKAWNQPISPFCFPYDKEKYRAFSDLLGKLFSSNPLHRGRAFFGALTTLAAWSLED
jgi:acyl-CoA reductase-like NAD-dependent aldehyde dehydrogenase